MNCEDESPKISKPISQIMEKEQTQNCDWDLHDSPVSDTSEEISGPEPSGGDPDDDSPLAKIGSFLILKSHVEKVILNAIIIVKEDCELKALDDQTHHHPSVSVTQSTTEIFLKNHQGDTPLDKHLLGSLDLYQKKLSRIINEHSQLTEGCLLSILQKIASGIQHLHKINKPHGQLAAECISLSLDDRNHPYICGAELNGNNAVATKEKDILDLGKLFYFALTNGKEYSGSVDSDDLLQPAKETDAKTSRELADTAKNLIDRMMGTCEDSAKITTLEEVVQHPLFWTDDQKINFVTDLFDSVTKRRDTLEELEKKALGQEIFETNWVKDLELRGKEKDALRDEFYIDKPFMDEIFKKAGGTTNTPKKNVEISVYISDGKRLLEAKSMELKKWNKHLLRVEENKENITRKDERVHKLVADKFKGLERHEYDVINEFVLIRKESDGGFQADSLYELLRFFRNRKAHYWEGELSPERTYYKAAGGFWNFYSKRYPKLLAFLHDNKSHFPYYAHDQNAKLAKNS